MRIKSLSVRNFRSIREAKVDLDNLTAFIGRNGAGKSSFLQALAVFYNPGFQITEEDYFNRTTTEPIQITVTFTELKPHEAEEFKPYLEGDDLTVWKSISADAGQQYFGTTTQIPAFAELRELKTFSERRSKLREIAGSGRFPNLRDTASNDTNLKQILSDYERDHPDLCERVRSPTQFFGPANIGGGKLDKFTKFVLIPAVREVADEAGLRRSSSLYQLLDILVLRQINARQDIRDFKTEVQEKAQQLFSPENLRELSALGVSISRTLEEFAPGSELHLRWGQPPVPDIPAPQPQATLTEDGYEGDITRKGHGLQRALILTLLQHLARTSDRQQTDSSQENNGAEPQTIQTDPDVILAIEEPELYLHPQRCRYLYGVLQRLSAVGNEPGTPATQVIYTTHSPHFVSLNAFDRVRIVRKVRSDESAIGETSCSSHSLEAALGSIAAAYEIPRESLSAQSFILRSANVMTSAVNEGFFADCVVVVEGPQDAAAIWAVQEQMQRDWVRLGISVVPAMGKNKMDRPLVAFGGHRIPLYFVVDGDAKNKDNQKKTAQLNRALGRLAKLQLEDFPTTDVKENCAFFEDCLETEIADAIGQENFNEFRSKIAAEFQHGRLSDVLKSPDGMESFIAEVYAAGLRIDVLESIVEAVTGLARAARSSSEP